MKNLNIKRYIRYASVIILVTLSQLATAATNLADQPLFSGSAVTGNVALALSVEFPTALGSAYTTAYTTATEYIGYFDPNKCYTYTSANADVNRHYFQPTAVAVAHTCVLMWSGNFLNWALTQTIDPFRYALTGGYRRIDEVGLTLLEKAWASGQGGTVADPTITGAVLIAGATPFTTKTTFKIRIRGVGNLFYFSSSTASYTADNYNPGVLIADTAIPTNPALLLDNRVYSMYARVQVCAAPVGIVTREANCTAYPNGDYKPTGLIQKNAKKLNFAAFGYLKDDNINRDGGVLRARMSQLGPVKSVPNSPDIVNPNAEWAESTGIFITNPDPVDALVNGVPNSGVINYLNKFGLTAPGYKTYDPVSELYYAAIRYYKNQGNVASYTSGATPAMVDGFPVITNWDDPIKYSCQANFIIGIGDENTHRDANLPGSTIRSNEPAMPAEVLADTTVDVRVSTDRVGALQGIANLGTSNPSWCCNQNTFFISGLAYDSYTKDIRPDIIGQANTIGKQTIKTYWLDVLESGFKVNNQFWLAAKFGGFDIASNYDPYSAVVTPLTTGQWDKNGDGDPDNYFKVNNPGLMITNLGKAFDDILKQLSAFSSAISLPLPSIDSVNNKSYSAGYAVATWSGSLVASTVVADTSGSLSTTQSWQARDLLETQTAVVGAVKGWDTARFITTSTGTNTANPGVPFRTGTITLAQQAALGVTGTDQLTMLNYLRGDRSNEGTQGTQAYRARTYLLGDIVSSKPKAVGAPSSAFTDDFNSGYSAFKSANSTRKTVVYIGSNDGMMHAFNGELTANSSTAGKELFAYVPGVLFNGPTSTPSSNGLAALSNKTFVHHYYVDSTPVVMDVNFGKAARRNTTDDWHSLLIGGLGKGGKAYYAIDVTTPQNLTTEAAVAAAVKWEFTDPRLGYTVGQPLITKTAKYGWVVVFTSGYNNSDGQGYFFFVDPKDGTLLEAVSTGAVASGVDSGLAHFTNFFFSDADGTSDAFYAGDLLGNVWRLDVTAAAGAPGAAGSYAAPTKIASLISPSNNLPQPITTRPIVIVDSNTYKRYVLIGTGSLLDNRDINNNQVQSFYSINDGTAGAFFTTATLPATANNGFPIVRADLNANNTGITGIGSNPANPLGFYVDLAISANNVASRVNTQFAATQGVVAFAANLPNGDACNPDGTYSKYIMNFVTGASILKDSTGAIVSTIVVAGSAVDVTFYRYSTSPATSAGSGSTETGVSFGGSDGAIGGGSSGLGSLTGYKQVNWRELPNPD